MAVIGVPVFVEDHAYNIVAPHRHLEGAADAAIGAGSDLRPFGLAHLQHVLFAQRASRTGLHAGPTRHAVRIQEGLIAAGRHQRAEAAASDGEREGALHVLARAHAARADDALRRVVSDIGLGSAHPGVAMLYYIAPVTH